MNKALVGAALTLAGMLTLSRRGRPDRPPKRQGRILSRLFEGALLGVFVALGIFFAEGDRADDRARLAEKFENTRFVRQLANESPTGNKPFAGLFLEGASLGGLNLTCADLTGTALANADLRGADLRGANLMDADLSGADLTAADLSGAVLVNATLNGANVQQATLAFADFSNASLDQTNFLSADISGAFLGRGGKRYEWNREQWFRNGFSARELTCAEQVDTRGDLRRSADHAARIRDADFTCAIWDVEPIWPLGFGEPSGEDCRLGRTNADG